jgi:hypothetical protein
MQYTATTYAAQRKGTRVRADIPLRLTSLDPALVFQENCRTVIVNPQGCGARVSRPLTVGLHVRLDELPCGIAVNGKVVNCVGLGVDAWLVGIALLEKPGNYWCLQPAPADWGSAATPICPQATVAPRAARQEWPYAVFSSKGEAHPGRK